MIDREVIERFVAFRAANGSPALKVDRWPEDEKDGDIDAIAGRFAIEHTSIDTLPEQRRQSAYLAQMLGELEKTVDTLDHFQLFLHYDAVQPGQDWPAVRRALKHWLETEGRRVPEKRTRLEIPGVPFAVDVIRRTKWRGPLRIYFARYVPAEDASLPARIKSLCDRKIEKLSKHASAARTTILLVENDDLALMNEIKLTDAVLEAYPMGRPIGVDEFWYVSTAIQPQLLFHDLSMMWELPKHLRYPEAISWPPEQ